MALFSTCPSWSTSKQTSFQNLPNWYGQLKGLARCWKQNYHKLENANPFDLNEIHPVCLWYHQVLKILHAMWRAEIWMLVRKLWKLWNLNKAKQINPNWDSYFTVIYLRRSKSDSACVLLTRVLQSSLTSTNLRWTCWNNTFGNEMLPFIFPLA